jgi:flavin reductase (DIM6/NTAB) family NADH-FMN oxidoreductase RutF
MDHSAIDPAHFRRVLGCHATGIGVVTARTEEDEPVGMAVTSFTSVSLDPPLVAFCPDRKSTTWPQIERAGRFCVNLLAEEQGGACRSFGSTGGDKFAGIDWRVSQNGVPVIEGALASIECEVHSVLEAGDHFIVLGRVLAMESSDERAPLLFFRSGFSKVALG